MCVSARACVYERDGGRRGVRGGKWGGGGAKLRGSTVLVGSAD